jgi:hypothetical protein
MTNYEQSLLNMYYTLKEYLLANSASANLLPNYGNISTDFFGAIPQIQKLSQQQKSGRTGIAEYKNKLREKLVVLTADYARKLTAFALFTNNTVLAAEVKISEGRLKQISDFAVGNYAQMMYDRAQLMLGQLAAYGITAGTQITLAGAITEYNHFMGRPGLSRAESSETTRQLKVTFQSVNEILKKLDAAVEVVRHTDPNFYNGYRSARKVIPSGNGSLAAKVQVTGADTGNPVAGVTVSFFADGMGNTPVLVKKTARLGGFKVKKMKAGMYHLTLSKPGYAGQTATLAVADGEMSVLNVQMSKN